jgi:hypothetical protein
MGTAAAKIRFHVLEEVAFGGPRITIEQSLSAHDHAGDAVPTLHRLMLDERLLQRTRMLDRAEAFYRAYRLFSDRRDRNHARENGLATHDHGARAALSETAAELRAVQLQVVAQHI